MPYSTTPVQTDLHTHTHTHTHTQYDSIQEGQQFRSAHICKLVFKLFPKSSIDRLFFLFEKPTFIMNFTELSSKWNVSYFLSFRLGANMQYRDPSFLTEQRKPILINIFAMYHGFCLMGLVHPHPDFRHPA